MKRVCLQNIMERDWVERDEGVKCKVGVRKNNGLSGTEDFQVVWTCGAYY